MTLPYSHMLFHRMLVRCESGLAKPQRTMWPYRLILRSAPKLEACRLKTRTRLRGNISN